MSDKYELGNIIRYADSEYSFYEGTIERILRNGKLTIKDSTTEKSTDITSDSVVINISYLENVIRDKIDYQFNYRFDDVCIKMTELIKKHQSVLEKLLDVNDKIYEIKLNNTKCCTLTNSLFGILFGFIVYLYIKLN